MKHFFATHGLNIIRFVLLATLASLVFIIVSLQKTNRDILVHVEAQQNVSDQAVKQLKEDNAQQTVILCTLILSNNASIQGDDVAKIESICKEKIQNATTDPKAQASDTSGAIDGAISGAIPQQQMVTQSSQPTQQQNPPTKQPEKPEEPPKPVEILGIPLCIPIVDTCVR